MPLENPGRYRSLFPKAYTTSRILPEVRILAPMWSFGFEIETIAEVDDDTDTTGLSRIYANAMWLMQEAQETTRGQNRIEKYHEPRLMTLRVQSVSSKKPNIGGSTRSYRRLSILALETLPDSKLPKQDRDIPVRHNTAVGPANGPLIVAPYDVPKPDSKYLAGKKRRKQFVPPFVLLRGHIQLEANPAYLTKARAQMGLTKPDFSEKPELKALENTLFLLPDGFALSGKIQVPWSAEAVSGWFKVCDRSRDQEAEEAGQQVMRPWSGDGIQPISGWLDGLWNATLRSLMLGLGRINTADPAWLRVSLNDRIDPDDLFWPSDNDGESFLYRHRSNPKKLTVAIENRGIAARLAYRPANGVPLTTLGIEPPEFMVTKTPSGIEFTGSVGTEAIGLNSRYRYRLDEDDKETFALDEGGAPVSLAVPMVETAERLRAATGLDTPDLDDDLGLLWTFTPIEGGWLHWPLPNATIAVLNQLVDDSASVTVPGPADGQRPSGAFSLANRPGLENARQDEHAWSFSLSECQYGKLRICVDNSPTFWRIIEADVDLEGGQVELDGLVPVVPFRQTETQLLPDHAERALTRQSLRAMSPGLLRGIERRLWDKGADAAAVARVEMTLENFAIRAGDAGHPDAAMRGIPRVRTTMRTGVAEDDKALNAALRPWLWLRHPVLPTVQTLPLALAGEAQRTPSGSRELAPLSRAEPVDKGKTIFAFRNAVKSGAFGHDIDLGKSTVPIFIDSKYQRETEAATWIDEVGMAVLTLPSLTLFPGVSAPAGKGRLKSTRVDGWPTPTKWNGIKAVIEFELRHDLALRDEAYAFATLPPREEPSDEDKDDVALEPPGAPPPMLFAPRPDNGPQGAELDGAVPDTVWADLWLRTNRLAALAATDDRIFVKPAAKLADGVLLNGVFGEEQFSYTSLKITTDTAMRFDTGGDPAADPEGFQVLEHVGQIELAGADPIALPGLPDERDLIGVNQSFVRTADGRPVNVKFGTATLTRQDKRFRDQRGLLTEADASGAPTETGSGFVLRKGSTSDATPKPFALLTLQSPLKFADGAKFWCADVPFDANGKGHLGAAATKTPENSAGFADNHLTGYRWALSGKAESRFLTLDGLLFEPLRLVGAALDKPISDDTARPVSFVVEGHLRLPLDKTAPERAPVAGGKVQLTLGLGPDGVTGYELSSDETLTWPLAAPGDDDTTPVPLLDLDKWPLPDKQPAKANGTLRFVLGGHTYSLALKAYTDGADLLCGWERGKDVSAGVFGLTGAKVRIAKTGNLFFPDTAEAVLRGRFVTGSWKQQLAAGRLVADLGVTQSLLDDATGLGDASRLHLESEHSAGIELPITPSDIPDELKEVDAKSIWFDGSVLGAVWTVPSHGKAARPILGAFDVSEGSGTTLAVLQHNGEPNGDFSVLDVRLTGALKLQANALQSGETKGVDLRLDIEEDDVRAAERGDFRLSGNLELPNLFRFPRVASSPVASLDDWKSATFRDADGTKQVYRHIARVTVDRTSVACSEFDQNVEMTLAATVAHEITDGARAVRWRSFETIRLTPMTAFRARLEALKAELDLRPAKHSTSAFHAFDTEYSVKEYPAFASTYHPFGARHADVTGILAEAWLNETNDTRPVLVIEVSGHHALGWEDGKGTKTTAVLPLSCIAALGTPDGSDTLFDEGGSEVLRLMRSLAPDGETQKVFLPCLESPLVEEAQIGLSEAAEQLAETWLHRADEAARVSGDDLATAVLFPDGKEKDFQRTVFQSFALIGDDPDTAKPPYKLATLTMPAAPMSVAISEIIVALPPDETAPQAMSFAEAGALRQIGSGGPFTWGDYSRSMKAFRDVAFQQAIASPDRILPPVEDAARTETAALFAAGQAASAVQRVALLREGDASLEQFAIWAKTTLARLAPWGAAGLLEVADRYGAATLRVMLPSSIERDERPSLPNAPRRTQKSEGQRVTGSGFSAAQVPSRIVAGYAPRKAGASLLASDPLTVTTPGRSTDGPRLTATGTDAAWLLDETPAPYLGAELGENEGETFWVASRMQVAYRPSAPMYGTKDRLSFALPSGFQAETPLGLLPAVRSETPGTVRRETAMRQAFAPGFVGMGRVSPRAGAWANERLGLSVAGSDDGVALAASEVPFHLRTPRPPLLARNDRPRASSYEDRHLAVSHDPQAILHGPRRLRQGTALEPTGLDRRPRSAWASLIRLAEPDRGLITTDWEGVFRLEEVETWGSGGDRSQLWLPKAATLRFDGQSFRAKAIIPPKDSETGKISGLHDIKLSEFRDEAGRSAEEVLKYAKPATPVVLELSVQENNGALSRKLRFALFSAGSGLNLTERQSFLRFDDPEYNDRLDGLAKLDSNLLPENELEITFACDRPDIRPPDRIEFAVGLRSQVGDPVTSGTSGTGFTEGDDGSLTFKGKPVTVNVELQRSGVEGTVQLGLRGESGEVDAVSIIFAGSPNYAALSVPCADLGQLAASAVRVQDKQPLLEPGDRLTFRLFNEAAQLVSLAFNVVTRPLLPSNPAGFALLALDYATVLKPDARVAAPIYAPSPAAAEIELVDPRDLLDGIVRRRAIYQWRLFSDFPRLNEDRKRRFALQKINSVGGSWLPSDLRFGWRDPV
ncbi:hypothetical protein [Ruegeria lacuscaerulensis]|uniref:hypothetical protein n=1 Tax=Ruegeria lacuscaerulensis TaxID=55218 RepID=UPI0014815C92|nr:hypothetical protein [Ruegeria lacuscaerulensis]